jgi:hypothetical protein
MAPMDIAEASACGNIAGGRLVFREQLPGKSCDAGEHCEFLLQAWQAANHKARELGWIV